MKFILEHSLSPSLSEILAILEGPAGHTVEHLRRFYPQDTERSGLAAATRPRRTRGHRHHRGSPRISRSPHEQAAWLESGLTIFFLRSFADLSSWEQAWRLVKWWPQIVKEASDTTRGSGFLVSVNGKIEQIRNRRGH